MKKLERNRNCFKCGKVGYMMKDCRTVTQISDKSKKTFGPCFNCGKKGHRAVDCWLPKKEVNDVNQEDSSLFNITLQINGQKCSSLIDTGV